MFKDTEARSSEDQQLTAIISDRLSRVKSGPASVTINYDQFIRDLAGFDFSEPVSLQAVGEFVSDATAFGSVPMTHPRYFGLFNPAPSYASEWGDRIAAAFNPQLAVWSHAPAPVDIEAHTVTALARRIGFADGAGGHFTSGGSEANETAVLCALTRADPRFATEGARSLTGEPALYVSRESHRRGSRSLIGSELADEQCGLSKLMAPVECVHRHCKTPSMRISTKERFRFSSHQPRARPMRG